MKKNEFLLLLIIISNYSFSQTTCNLLDLTEKLHMSIEQDEKRPDSISVIEPLTLSVGFENGIKKEVIKAHQIFSYNAGFTFRFYVLSSNSFENDAVLKLYLRSEDNSKPNVILISLTDKSGDNEFSLMEYINYQVSDFILELSLGENKPGCATAMVIIYPTLKTKANKPPPR